MRGTRKRLPSWVLLAALPAACLAAGPPSAAGATAAARDATVVDGRARFEVLTPTLIRMEYAGDGRFEDRPTFTAVDRHLPAPPFRTWTRNGYRYIATARQTLSYQEGSGPFTPSNTTVRLRAGTAAAVAHPTFQQPPGVCLFDTACEAENGDLAGGALPAVGHHGHTGGSYVEGFEQAGASITYRITAVPSDGDYALAVRYANSTGSDGRTTTRTLSARAGAGAPVRLTLPPTAGWDDWATASVPVHLAAGTNTVTVTEELADSGRVNVDSLAVTPPAAPYPPGHTVLGGYRRSLDLRFTAAPLAPGLLTRDGWYLLDDSATALFDPARGTVTPRPSHGGLPYQDGYLFAYGPDYRRALSDLRSLTGPAAMLPESAFGVWFSRYHPYTASDYATRLLPRFRAEKVPLDVLVADTDWKAPLPWNGWNWNPELFPDPRAFLAWAHTQGLTVSLNVHPSITTLDPRYAETQAIARSKLDCTLIVCTFDWSDPDQLAAYLALHRPLEQQGVDAWWLDWCCDASRVSLPGVTPDAWINAQYAADGEARGRRGYVLSRIGSSVQSGGYFTSTAVPTGPWADHRYAVHFTGDTLPTWSVLAFEAEFTADEGAIGLPYVSHDIGSFHGRHDPDDLYARWVQLGTFQPVLRLHSNHGDRLPWEYGTAARTSAARFLRLRESLVPYTYTLAEQAVRTGVPLVRAMYLDYPASDEAYRHPRQYLYGDGLLVAPVTTPDAPGGGAETTVWFPPGSSWTDYFTGRTYAGGTVRRITTGLDTMPVFLKSGAIVPRRTDYTDHVTGRPLSGVTLDIAAGDGSFRLYEDAGEGHGYRTGQYATTRIRTARHGTSTTVTIGPRRGDYPGAVTHRAYVLRLFGTDAPRSVTAGTAPVRGWSYDPATRTTTVPLPDAPTASGTTVTVA